MIPIASLRDIHPNRPGAVLGGGPSLPTDLLQVPPGALMISVNHHGLQLVQADYLVYLDEPGPNDPALLDAVNSFQGMKVSRQPESDVDLGGSDWWHEAIFSGQVACWFACWLGCDPVLLCGMDCYQNPIPPGEDPKNLAYQTPLEKHLDGWRLAFTKCAHPERIKAVSGPLVDIFGVWRKCSRCKGDAALQRFVLWAVSPAEQSMQLTRTLRKKVILSGPTPAPGDSAAASQSQETDDKTIDKKER